MRSMRSSQSSRKRTEDWVRQAKVAESSGRAIDLTPTSMSVSAGHLEDPQVVHPSSTPLRTVISPVGHPLIGNNVAGTGSEVKSIPGTLGSITIGEDSEDSVEGAVGVDVNQIKQTSDLPFVDLQPYADILKIEDAAPIIPNTGAISKLTRFGDHCYKRWSVETGDLRRRNDMQIQHHVETERDNIRDLSKKYQVDIEARRKRELELVNRIASLQVQYERES